MIRYYDSEKDRIVEVTTFFDYYKDKWYYKSMLCFYFTKKDKTFRINKKDIIINDFEEVVSEENFYKRFKNLNSSAKLSLFYNGLTNHFTFVECYAREFKILGINDEFVKELPEYFRIVVDGNVTINEKVFDVINGEIMLSKEIFEYGVAANQSWDTCYFVKCKNNKIVDKKELRLDYNRKKFSVIFERPSHFYDNQEDCCVWLVSDKEWDDLHICECCGKKI